MTRGAGPDDDETETETQIDAAHQPELEALRRGHAAARVIPRPPESIDDEAATRIAPSRQLVPDALRGMSLEEPPTTLHAKPIVTKTLLLDDVIPKAPRPFTPEPPREPAPAKVVEPRPITPPRPRGTPSVVYVVLVLSAVLTATGLAMLAYLSHRHIW
jgi:hypothetical protein